MNEATVAACVAWASDRLKAAGIEQPRRAAVFRVVLAVATPEAPRPKTAMC